MEEEGLQDTANLVIHIGKPIDFDEELFLRQLDEIKDYVVTEPSDIKQKIQQMVPTYSIQGK